MDNGSATQSYWSQAHFMAFVLFYLFFFSKKMNKISDNYQQIIIAYLLTIVLLRDQPLETLCNCIIVEFLSVLIVVFFSSTTIYNLSQMMECKLLHLHWSRFEPGLLAIFTYSQQV